MDMSEFDVLAWECRDREDLAKASYNTSLRRVNNTLNSENLRLKRLLREHGISWSTVSQAHLINQTTIGRRTRSSMTSLDLGRPHLPMEVILRILGFAMTSPYPIIDPLSRSTLTNLTDDEKNRGNQIAIHFLATCKALHEEGTRMLWTSNTFVFTTPQAVQNFAELSLGYRSLITQVTFRVIARYYDDQIKKRKLDRVYHHSLKKDVRLRVNIRPREQALVRGGFRCYTWNQVTDFLFGLRAPYDPSFNPKSSFHPKSEPRPKLLPELTTLRLDLVNFSDSYLPFSGPEFHDVTSHEFGCTLNELQVTGLPEDDVGAKAGAELSGLLKDEGLYLEGAAAFVMPYKGSPQALHGGGWVPRVVRAYNGADDDSDSDLEMSPDSIFLRGHVKTGLLPAAPAETGHPDSARPEEYVIWKKVPDSRDGTKRSWIQFSRYSGKEIFLDGEICPCCGEAHPNGLWGLMDEDEDDDEMDSDDD